MILKNGRLKCDKKMCPRVKAKIYDFKVWKTKN